MFTNNMKYTNTPDKKKRQKVLNLRDEKGLTFKAIGKAFRPHITRQRAYQIYVKAKQAVDNSQ